MLFNLFFSGVPSLFLACLVTKLHLSHCKFISFFFNIRFFNPFSTRISNMQKSIVCHQFNFMKDRHTINLILISSKWLIPSFGVCSWWINSSSKCFHLFFSGVQISSAISSEPPSKSPQGLKLYSFILHFYLIILLSTEFFMVVLHDLIHSSRVHQDSCWWSSSIFSSGVSKCN